MTRLFLHFLMILVLSSALPSLAFAAAPDVAKEDVVANDADDETNVDHADDDEATDNKDKKDDKKAEKSNDDDEDKDVSPIGPVTLTEECKSKLANEKLYDEKKKKSYKTILSGNEGWLFRDGTDLIQEIKVHNKGIKGLKELTKTLEKRGITLVVAYLPTRGIVAGSHLPKPLPEGVTFDMTAATESYKGLADKMRGEGVHFVTVPNFAKDNEFFRKTDHHWNTAGARQMAQAVADYTKKLKVYGSLKKTTFESAPSQVFDFQGSFAEVVESFCDQPMPHELDQGFETAIKADEGDLANALMGETTEPEVVLVGTSNSKAERFSTNFDGALKEFLSVDVYNAALAGAGIDEPLFAYLASDTFRAHPPKVIIWEIPGYYSLSSERDMFRQAVPAVYGDCGDKAVAKIAPTKINGGDMGSQVLAKGLEGKKITADSHYIYLKFNQPVKKAFTLLTDFNAGKTDKFKFRRGKRYPYDGMYYAILKGEEGAYVTDFSIDAPKEMDGVAVEGRVCRLSASAITKEKKKASFFDWFKKDDNKDAKKDKKDKKREKKKDGE